MSGAVSALANCEASTEDTVSAAGDTTAIFWGATSPGNVSFCARIRCEFDSSWQACSKAIANARIVGKRSFGSLASAVNTTCSTRGEIDGTCSHNEGGGASICFDTISVNEPPVMGILQGISDLAYIGQDGFRR